MKYTSDPTWYRASRAEYLRAAIERDEMVLNECERADPTDLHVKQAKRLAKRRIARNTKELEKS